MLTRRLLTGAAIATGVIVASVGAADAKRDEPNPSQICRDVVNDPIVPKSKPAFGGCTSTFASVGNLFDPDFPSNSLAVANCRDLEQSDFLDPNEPNPGGPYPYQFYWFAGSDPATFTAYNRADCVRLLEVFHTMAQAS